MLAATLIEITLTARDASHHRRDAEYWQVHTLDVLLAAGAIKSAANAALRGERGYLLTDDRRFLEPYAESRREIPMLLDRLRRLTADNPLQRAKAARLGHRLDAYFALLDRTIALAEAGRKAEALRGVRLGLGRRGVSGPAGQAMRVHVGHATMEWGL